MRTEEYVNIICPLICAIGVLCGMAKGIAVVIKKWLSAKLRHEIEIESENEAHGRDVTKYLLDDDPTPYGKGRLVLAVVRKFVSQNPQCTFDGLRQIFQDGWQNRFVVRTTDGDEWKDKRLREHDFFWRDDDLVVLGDGTKIMVCRQWGIGNIDRFLNGARALGFVITPYGKYKQVKPQMLSTSLMVITMLISVTTLNVHADTWTDSAGYTWSYYVSGEEATITGVSPAEGDIAIPASINSVKVTSIGWRAFRYCSGLTSVTIPDSVTGIGDSAFYDCSGLTSITIPGSVTRIEYSAFQGCSGLTSITIPGSVTRIGGCAFYDCSGLTSVTMGNGVTSIGNSAFRGCTSTFFYKGGYVNGMPLPSNGGTKFTREHGASFVNVIGINNFYGYWDEDSEIKTEVVSTKMRENNPTIMDIKYIVHATNETVKVRALAFQDGVQSFSNIVRTVTFTDDTKMNVGDNVAANVTNSLSWQVAVDWNTDLAQVAFGVMAMGDELLPLCLETVPATETHEAITFSWNCISDEDILNALYWLVADGDEGLVVLNGQLKTVNGGTVLVNGNTIKNGEAALRYIYAKMGYEVLSGDDLAYVNTVSRLGLSPSGSRQYAVKKGVNNQGE